MDVSVIIPCFNSAEFLPDAIRTAEMAIKGFKAEIIIVDDGSTQKSMLDLLNKLEETGKYSIVHRKNGGPAAARNSGVKISKGKYLLFLDSDNKLRPNFISTTLPLMKSDAKNGVVYGEAEFFGDNKERKPFKSGPLDKYALLIDNYIDACSLVRRSAWEEVGGFDEDPNIIGYEDWEFWIHLSTTAWEFKYIPEIIFDYRLRKDSVITNSALVENYKRVTDYIYHKHIAVIMERFGQLYHESLFYKRDMDNPLRSFLKFSKRKYLSRQDK